ncbi:CbiX/SirB N-terminal domain-containing protein [Haloplanus sp. C73]|uniref:CbiX/SirB N-terminal domain-containing protein n=1 Tax=Haloplanus sp. C73 TaxID=3421641 RepID=UPI003EBE604D
MTDQALIVAAHGSHRNPDSATPTYEHVDAIRDRGCFAQVREAFWKESPSFRDVIRTVDADEAYIVPLFISEGYFVDQVLPREFALGITDMRGTDHEPEVIYTDPVGTHPEMTDVVAARARRYLDDDVAESETALAVIGHGTERNPNSADAIYNHVDALRETTDFAEVGALFMDEAPYVDDVLEAFDADNIAVVPLFIADGFHTQDEIPELLGLTDDPRAGYPVPGEVSGRRIWYTSAVGTDPLMPEVLLERAADAGADIDHTAPETAPVRPDAADAFVSWVDSATTREWGELAVTHTDAGYALRHHADADASREALSTRDLDEFRSFARSDDDGRYRPFAGEESLPTGWTLDGLDADGLCRAVAAVYPAAIETWHDDPDAVPYREVAARQTGIYERVSNLSREGLIDVTTAVCGNCAKRRDWDESADDSLPVERGAGELPCREPCSFLVAAAREMLVDEPLDPDEQAPDHPDADVPPGDLTDPANRYRVRYRQARGAPEPTH